MATTTSAEPQPAGAAEITLAVVGLFALTLGPIYTLRTELGGFDGIWEDDPFVRAVFAGLYVLAAIPLVGEIRRRGLPLVVVPFAALCAWAVASTLWSEIPGITLWRAMLFAGTTLFGLFLGRRFSSDALVAVTLAAMLSGVATSMLVVWRRPDRGIMTRDGNFWAGIYFNRNSLAPVAALAIICAVLFMVRSTGIRLVGGAAAFTVSAIVLAETQARTALAALGGSLAVAAAAWLLAQGRGRGMRGRDAAALAVTAVTLSVALAYLVFDRAVASVGVDPTLDNRTPLWNFVRMEIGLRPLEGYGFYSYWIDPGNRLRILGWIVWEPPSAHNGFLEVALGLGYVGAALLAVGLGWAALRTARRAWWCEHPTGVFGIAMVAFFVLTDLTESFTLPNQFIWALFVAVAVAGPLRPAEEVMTAEETAR